MHHRVLIKPWEFLACISISIVILYVLALQLVVQARSFLLIFTLISLFASIVQLKSIDLGGWYTVFIVFTSITSLIVTDDLSICIFYITTLIKAFVFFLAVINCMKLNRGFLTIRYSTIIAGIILSYMLLFRGVVASDSLRRSAAEGINENVVAASITVAIALTLYDIIFRKKKIKIYFEIAAVIFMCSAVLLTGTRKSFIAIIILLALYMLFIVIPKKSDSNKNQIRGLVFAVVGIAALLCFIKYGIDQTSIGERFKNIGYQGDKMRVYYYIQSLRIFIENPLFGTGWGGFVAQIGMYSHSTYGELIANTGVMGCLLFVSFYFSLIYRGINRIRIIEKERVERNLCVFAIISILAILFLGIGTAIFYEINLTLCVGIAYAILKDNTFLLNSLNKAISHTI